MNPEATVEAPEVRDEPTLDFEGREINIGDVVVLRHADYPLMTVEYADPTSMTNMVSCVWHDMNDQPQRQQYTGKTLIICDEVDAGSVIGASSLQS